MTDEEFSGLGEGDIIRREDGSGRVRVVKNMRYFVEVIDFVNCYDAGDWVLEFKKQEDQVK